MSKTYFQRIAIVFSVLLIISNLAYIQPQVVDAETVEDAVTISALDENGEDVLPLTAIGIEEGDTAFDVLVEAGEIHDLEVHYDEYDFGKMLTGIGDVVSSDPFYWSFNVYGIGPDVGASSYEVSNGEHLFFTLTENFTPSVDVTVSAHNKDGNAVIPETTVTLMEGATAYDALFQAAKENNVTIDASIDNQYFTFINNIAGTELGEGDYWNIAVDDQTLSVGIVAHQVQPDEHVQLTVQTFDTGGEDSTGEGDIEEPNDPESSTVSYETIQKSINDIITYTNANNIDLTYGNEWWVWGLANTNQVLPETYVASVKDEVKEIDGEFRSIFDLEKVIIGLSAAGIDATSVEGYNLVEKLINHKNFENPSINMAIYGLLALDSGQYKVPTEDKNLLIDFILDNEQDDGGWALFGDRPTADITGMVLTALAPYQDRQDVKQAIDRAVNYLSTEQDDTSGYYEEFNGGDTSESVSQVITGLTSVGIDPTSDAFTKDGGNLVEHLLKFKQDDGGFSHIIDDEQSMGMSTQQALLALIAYQKQLNDGGLVYQFPIASDEDNSDTPENPNNPVEPSNPSEPENPSKPDESGNKEENVENQSETESETGANSGSKTNQQSKQNSNITKSEPTIDQVTDTNNNGDKLPNTATDIYNLLGFGMVLLAGGVILFIVQRRKRTNA
ncbi:DUF4430 domain-containing protein [Oceanobacillus halotolerans]|uniref:DUF4430 domain-containing protein n=1 Tax=Oceanobacillus halotolerans TaxID=2663380 RepID=UPI0013DA4E22|nr:DUF4430 domain-containing protein [Oceanobacillus halotolerans]